MNLDKLVSLKMKLVAENDFSVIWEYFMDNFAENEEFLDCGHPMQDDDSPIPKAVATAAATALASAGIRAKAAVVGNLIPIHIPEQQFVHGAMIMQGHLVTFFYFEDLDVGLVYVHISGDDSRMLRVTVRPDNGPKIRR